MSEIALTVIPVPREAIASFGSGGGTSAALARGKGRSGQKNASKGAYKNLVGRVNRSGNKALAKKIAAGPGAGKKKFTNKQHSALQAEHKAFTDKMAKKSVAAAKKAAGGPGAYARAAGKRKK